MAKQTVFNNIYSLTCFQAVRHTLDQSLSGGPVTRIPSDDEDCELDPCPDDLDVNWIHPTRLRVLGYVYNSGVNEAFQSGDAQNFVAAII